MSFLDRLKPRPRPTPVTRPPVHVTVGRTFGDPEAAAVKAAATARDWPALRTILDAGHHQDDFDFLLGQAARVEGTEEWLPDLIRADGDDLLAPTLFGYRLVNWAWEARTAASARFVSADRWPVFRQRLEQAEEVLLDVVRRDPGNVTAWDELIIACRGLSRPLAEQRKHFDRAVEIDPHNFLAHTLFLQGACAKWQGSHEIMHEFAHRSAAKAPGSRLGALVPLAHWEHWLSEETPEQLKYFQKPSVRRDLVDAAEQSVLHPAYERRRNWPLDNNPFAPAFVFASEFARARQQFEVLDGWASEVPWGWMKGGPEAAYLRLHHRAYTS
jgi:hypothetical protein